MPTGVQLSIPPGLCAWITPRSGSAYRSGLTVLNAPGLIDQDFRGEIYVILSAASASYGTPIEISRGDRIAQLVFSYVETPPMQHVTTLGETERNRGGFGSTG